MRGSDGSGSHIDRGGWPAAWVVSRAVLLATMGLAEACQAAGSSESRADAIAPAAPQAAAVAGTAVAAGPAPRRLYVSGMVASSVHGRASDSSAGSAANPLGLSGQGALGVAIPRPAGALRLELEGRSLRLPGPEAANQTAAAVAAEDTAGTGSEGGDPAADSAGWVTTVNAWRDVALPAHVGLYAGGGIGMASVTDAAAAGGGTASGLAWQAGGGITYAATDRLTIDIGYRVSGADPAGLGRSSAGEPTGEALVAIRLFEPFGGWSRR